MRESTTTLESTAQPKSTAMHQSTAKPGSTAFRRSTGMRRSAGDAYIKGPFDYAVFDNPWDGGQVLTYTRSNKMWRVDWFYGTGEELISKAYKDSKLSGQCYEAIVRAQESIDMAVKEANADT